MADYNDRGLQDVIAGETEICRLEGKFQYRGYDVSILAEWASFLEVAHLLLFDEFPGEEELADFLSVLAEEQELPSLVLEVFQHLPLRTSPMEALRTGISLLSHFDPQPDADLLQCGHAQTIRLLARVPLLIGAWHRLREGLAPLTVQPALSYVGNICYGILGTPPCALHERALETALTVIADHEFNPSTYVARIVGSTRSNQYGPVLAALEAFNGAEHLGGDDRPLDVLDEACRMGGADAWLESVPPDARIPGFGHPIHREEDPRVGLLTEVCANLAEASGRNDMELLARDIQCHVWRSRRLPANVDWPLSRLLSYLGFPRDLFQPLFVTARLVGWSAHALEQSESGVVIRPRAKYCGAEDCPFEPMRRRP